jgi:hypothetical protein
MIEKIGNLAERLATNVSQSRRGFLARVGQAALGAAGVLGGLLALPGSAQAGGGSNKGHCAVDGSEHESFYTGVCVTSRCTYGFSSACTGPAAGRKQHCGGSVGNMQCSF